MTQTATYNLSKQSLPPGEIKIDRTVGRFRYGAKGVSLSACQIQFLEELVCAYPDAVITRDRSGESVRSIVKRLRKSLKRAGLNIETVRGVGYILEIPQTA